MEYIRLLCQICGHLRRRGYSIRFACSGYSHPETSAELSAIESTGDQEQSRASVLTLVELMPHTKHTQVEFVLKKE
jgi:hypothetical protein